MKLDNCGRCGKPTGYWDSDREQYLCYDCLYRDESSRWRWDATGAQHNGRLQNDYETLCEEHEKLKAQLAELTQLKEKAKEVVKLHDRVKDVVSSAKTLKNLIAKYGELEKGISEAVDGVLGKAAKLVKSEDVIESFEENIFQ